MAVLDSRTRAVFWESQEGLSATLVALGSENKFLLNKSQSLTGDPW